MNLTQHITNHLELINATAPHLAAKYQMLRDLRVIVANSNLKKKDKDYLLKRIEKKE